MKKAGLGAFIRNLVFVPYCRGCGQRQDIFTGIQPTVLCPECLRKWTEALSETCKTCGLPYTACRCIPRVLDRAGCEELYKLTAYTQYSVPGRLILQGKDGRDRELFAFWAQECQKHIPLSGAVLSDAVLTYAPRRHRAVLLYGHDQAAELARALGKLWGMPVEKTLLRRIGGKAQKKNRAAGRRIAARRAYRPTKHLSEKLRNKTVILLDDIATSGETLAAATAILKENGAALVYAVVLAVTEKESQKGNQS